MRVTFRSMPILTKNTDVRNLHYGCSRYTCPRALAQGRSLAGSASAYFREPGMEREESSPLTEKKRFSLEDPPTKQSWASSLPTQSTW